MTIIDPELDDRSYSHLLTLLSVSAAMVGVCLTAVGLVSVIEALNKIGRLGRRFAGRRQSWCFRLSHC